MTGFQHKTNTVKDQSPSPAEKMFSLFASPPQTLLLRRQHRETLARSKSIKLGDMQIRISNSISRFSVCCSSNFSAPLPVRDVFAYPSLFFPNATPLDDYRPELVGALLWTTALYLGLSPEIRWGALVRTKLNSILMFAGFPEATSDLISAAFHSAPFLAAGFALDALLLHSTGGNAVWAVASGLSFAMYAGVAELGRASARAKRVESDTERELYALFCEFAGRCLERRGRCHLTDVRAALRKDARTQRLNRVSDEMVRRFVRNYAPGARRSPNGYYRGLSVRVEPKSKNDATTEDAPISM